MSRRLTNRRSIANLEQGINNLSLDPRRSTIGRQSMYGRQSMGLVATLAKDPRPLKDKRWQQQSIQKLVQFLVQSGYPFPISIRTFQSCSSKDFQQVFKFMFGQIDPYYIFELKFEEEVPTLLKGLRYPFADQINKSNLFTVGSLHAWPTLLGMLVWMVDLVLSLDKVDMEDEAGLAEATFLEYLTKAYNLWLDGSDDLQIIDQGLFMSFHQKQQEIEKEIQSLSEKLQVLDQEWRLLNENESPLSISERELTILESDRQKFTVYISHLNSKHDKLKEDMVNLHADLKQSEQEITKLNELKESLTLTVENQELSPSDVDRMNSERDQLANSIAATNEQLDDINNQVWNKEIAIQKLMDNLERSVERFNSTLYRLDLIANADPKYKPLSKDLELNLQQSSVSKMVSVNLNGVVKPLIEQLIEEHRSKLFKYADEKIAINEKIDVVGLSLIDRSEKISELESNIATLNSHYTMEKEQIGGELKFSNKELEEIERRTQSLKMESNHALSSSAQRLQKAIRRYEDGKKQLHHQRDSILGDVIKGLTTVFSNNQLITNSLEELHMYALESLESLNSQLV